MEELFTARLPGDPDDHPLRTGLENPLPGTGLGELARMLRAGFEDPELERAVRTYLIGMARMSDGDLVLDGSGDKSHHREPEPEQARRPYTGHLSYRR